MWYNFLKLLLLHSTLLLITNNIVLTITEQLKASNNELSTIVTGWQIAPEITNSSNFNYDNSSNNINKKSNNNDANESSEHASLDAFETLRRTFKGVEKLVYHLLNEDYMPEDSNDVLAELSYNAEKSLEIIGRQMFDFGNNLLTDVFKRLQEQVDRMKIEFEHMTDDVINNFDYAVTYLNVTVMNHSEQIDNWAADLKQQLRTVNNTEFYKNGCKKVDKMVATSTKLLRKCCNVTIRPLKSFCWKSRSIFTNTLSLLVDIFERIQFCIEDRESYNYYLMPCLNVAYNDISNLIERAIALRQKLVDSIPLKLMVSRECFTVALVHIEEHQIALTRNLTSFESTSL